MLPHCQEVRVPGMPQSVQSPERWIPGSMPERELVLRELESILASYHFRGSKRYPAFLKYVVDAALEGRTADLKERTLGVEVFGRHPDYDTNADPVVRFSASEVRKRIAQFYHENGHDSRLQIELPLGSYVPEFHPLDPVPDGHSDVPSAEPAASGANSVRRGHRFGVLLVSLAVLLLIAAGLGAYSYRLRTAKIPPTLSDRLWTPMVASDRPVLIVLGTGGRKAHEPDETSFLNHMTGPFHHVSVATAIALANVAGALKQRDAQYEIKEDSETSLTDLHSRPVVLIGATNNPWTMRLVAPLRFRFQPGPMAQVQDLKDPHNADWLIDFSKPYSSVSADYAIVARYHDSTTEGNVMVVAGLGPYGTEAASDFVATPRYLEQIVKEFPAGWDGKNVEVVLKSDVIDGKPGPPVVVSSTVW